MNENKFYLEPSVIINTIADFMKMSPDEVISTDRHRLNIRAKHIAMYFMREFTPLSLKEIGWFYFNHKDHCTVIHAVKQVNNQQDIYTAYRNEIKQIEKILISHAKYDPQFEKYEKYETESV